MLNLGGLVLVMAFGLDCLVYGLRDNMGLIGACGLATAVGCTLMTVNKDIAFNF